MKYFGLLGLIVALGTIAPAISQTMPPTPNPAMRQHFEQMRRQMQQIHTSERAQILNSLMPAHKTMLATIVGQLAVSPNPDVAGAARRLDATLSPAEKQAILNASQNARTQERTLMNNFRNATGMGGPEHGFTERQAPPGQRQMQNDAGFLLLHLAIPGPAMGMGPPMHP